VLREGLRLVEQQKLEYRVRLDALRQAVNIGIADFEAGNFQTFDSAQALAADLATMTTEALGSV
jgi:antitoxin ParD1/3/4